MSTVLCILYNSRYSVSLLVNEKIDIYELVSTVVDIIVSFWIPCGTWMEPLQ